MSIVIKGIKQGVLVTLNDQGDWDTLLAELEKQVEQRQSFFAGSDWVIDVQGRTADQAALLQLRNLLDDHQVNLRALLSTVESTREAAQALELFTALDEIPAESKVASAEEPTDEYILMPVDSEEYGTGGVLIKRTLRSGRTVRSSGHVVVIGDVNSGAEIVAAGDVVVWGKVRGMIHAGAMGDESAVVCALDLAPTQLRIAGLISIPPQDKRRTPRPEMAQVKDGQIEAIPWNQ